MKSIRTKLIVSTLILVILPFLLSNIANYFYMSKSYQQELKQKNEEVSHFIGSEVTSFIEKGYSITEQLSLNSDVRGFVPEMQVEALLNAFDKNSYFDLLHIEDITGMQTARTSGEVGDRSGRWWFKKVAEEKTSFVSKSYYSASGNVAVTTIAMPIYDSSKNYIGVMAADIKLDALQSIIDEYSKGSKYAFIVDGEGVVIAHPETTQVKELYNYVTMKKTVLSTDSSGNVILDEAGNQVTEESDIQVPKGLQKIVSLALDGQTGSETYKNNEGVEVISAYSTVTLSGASDSWAIITVENKSDAFEFITNTAFFSLLFCIGAIILTVILVSIIAGRIASPIKKSSQYLSRIAAGDFSIEVDPKILAGKDETGTIANGIQDMKNALNNLITSISNEALSIDNEVTGVITDMKKLNGEMESVSATTEELAASTEESAAASQEMTATSQEIEKAAQNIADNSHKGTLAAKDISIRAEQIKKNVSDAQEKAAKVLYGTKEQLQNAILESKAVEQISILTESIMAITEQTNLLALNAAIEAARAGDAGKGFSVVAEEIKKLAEQSKSTAEEIQTITSKVTLTVNNLSDSSSNLLNFVTTDVSDDYSNMLSVAEQYNADAQFVDVLLKGFHVTAEELLESIGNILEGIDGVAVAANESAEGTTDIASRVSEASVMSSDVTQKVQKAKESADILKQEVLKFKL